jgi:signal transduction histidine kinase
MKGPRRAVATRVLVSFAATVLAFAITLGWSVEVQRRAAQDNEELAKGYTQVALQLGQLRAAQGTISTLLDGITDERNPVSTKPLLDMLASARRTKLADTRVAMTTLAEFQTPETQALARQLLAELASVKASLEEDMVGFDDLYRAMDAGDKDGVNRVLVTLGAIEHDADKRLKAMSERVSSSMDESSKAARERERRSILALIALATVTLAVGVGVSFYMRRVLAPLARVTERAKAVGRGDLTPHEVEPTSDEIGELAVAFEKMVGAVARAQERAVSNERLAAIGKMAAHVTHEIRNPLSSIGLNIELLEEELASANVRGESKALLAAITREVQRLEHLSEEYLRVARLPSPRMEADDVAAAVREIVDFARPEIERAGCEVALEVQEDCPHALFDEAQIRQALLNLLRNAREAMPNGGRIDVGVSAEGMSVVVSVKDRGAGISDEIRKRVFDPFFSTKGEGTGLGLAITRQIVEAHGGSVTCEPRDGGGTVFKIALPIAPARASAPASARARVVG